MAGVRAIEDADRGEAIATRVREAAARAQPLVARAGGTRGALVRSVDDAAEALDLADHQGIVSYEPDELVLVARAGTPLAALEARLAEHGQMLAFEPPRLGAASTLGGAVATGAAGPRRPWGGAVRDLVLGVTVVDGRGERLRFGGQVMKNVAGYDAARLMAGAFGTLGVLLDVSLKVWPCPEVEKTRVLELDMHAAHARVTELAREPLPLTATAWVEGRLYIRLSGTDAGVAAAAERVGGEPLAHDAEFWRSVRDLTHPFFTGDAPLWRLALPSTAAQPEIDGRWLVGWAGAERWCVTEAPAETVLEAAADRGGHALRWRPEVCRTPITGGAWRLHEQLKAAFDPHRILNRDRLYAGL